MEPVKSVDSTSVTVQDSSSKTTLSIEMQSFCARVMNFCDHVAGMNMLTDVQGLKDTSVLLKKEALGVSKSFYKL